MKYTYDEEGMTFYFFLLTLVALYALPTTYRLIFPNVNDRFKDKVKCSCEDCKKNQKRKSILKKVFKNKFGWVKYNKNGPLITAFLTLVLVEMSFCWLAGQSWLGPPFQFTTRARIVKFMIHSRF